ncbi:hypothetical protein MATL_G00160570 [Megalops atlanticus]|uniref:Metadherin n=1 Tax=Megalops atlanticus TaxID=7932 RepID=A0A9D3PSP3_MEGAT|nr:hypothetical protein MATL_G00160570 [Megalops atlanticus]
MFGLLVRSIFEAGQGLFRGSVLSDIIQHWIGSSFLTLISVLLGGVVFFVIVSLRRRGQRGVSSTFSVDFNNTDVSLEQVLQTPFRLTVKRSRQEPTKKKRREKERDQANGQAAASPESSATQSEVVHDSASPDNRPLKPKKKKRKPENVEDRVILLSNDLFSSRERTEEEETGVWERKMTSKEKRQLRKERMKRKESPRGSSQQRPVLLEGAARWNGRPHREGEWQPCPLGDTVGPGGAGSRGIPEGLVSGGSRRETRSHETGKASRRAVELVPPSRLEEDIFSHVGTWDSKDVKTEPVTFGTVPDMSSDFGNSSSQPSPSQEKWSSRMTSLGIEDAWLGLEDSSDVDQTSDWKPPKEEWGNWGGEEGALAHDGGQGEGLKKSKEGVEDRTTLQGADYIAQSSARVETVDDTETKKDRKKRRRMRKET